MVFSLDIWLLIYRWLLLLLKPFPTSTLATTTTPGKVWPELVLLGYHCNSCLRLFKEDLARFSTSLHCFLLLILLLLFCILESLLLVTQVMEILVAWSHGGYICTFARPTQHLVLVQIMQVIIGVTLDMTPNVEMAVIKSRDHGINLSSRVLSNCLDLKVWPL